MMVSRRENGMVKYVPPFPAPMIRSAGVTDLDALYALEVVCFAERRFTRDHLLYILKNPRAATFVYEVDGRVAGALMLHDERGTVRILSVGVHPSHRRQGVGMRLMEVAEDLARRFGARDVLLEVSTRNPDAVAFYEALGYETAEVLPAYYSWGDDAYAMRKPVAVPVRKA